MVYQMMDDDCSSYTLSRHSSIDGQEIRPLPLYPGEQPSPNLTRKSWLGSVSMGRSTSIRRSFSLRRNISLRRSTSSASQKTRPGTVMSFATDQKQSWKEWAKSAGIKLVRGFAISASVGHNARIDECMVPSQFVF